MLPAHDNNIIMIDVFTYQYIDFDDSMTPEQRQAMKDSNALAEAYNAHYEAIGDHDSPMLESILEDIEVCDKILTVSNGRPNPVIDMDSLVATTVVTETP